MKPHKAAEDKLGSLIMGVCGESESLLKGGIKRALKHLTAIQTVS